MLKKYKSNKSVNFCSNSSLSALTKFTINYNNIYAIIKNNNIDVIKTITLFYRYIFMNPVYSYHSSGKMVIDLFLNIFSSLRIGAHKINVRVPYFL